MTGWVLAIALLAAPSAAQDLDARIRAAAPAGGVTWVGYRAPIVAGTSQMGCHEPSRIVLEPPAEVLVLTRLENGAVTRLRVFTPDCELDTSGATLVWLRDVAAADSVSWLSSLVSRAGRNDEVRRRVVDPALSALSLHAGDGAVAALVGFARTHALSRVRSQALFWLAHRAGQQAVAAIANAIDHDPETEVKKRAVFALSQLPADEGVPKLIEVARTHGNPEVRKQAFFWLGQSRDPRAVRFFEEVLLGKP